MGRLALLGGGKMGEALLGGLIASGWSPGDLAVAEQVSGRRDEVAARFPGVMVVAEAGGAARGARTVVVAVKPNDVEAALEAAAPVLAEGALVLSIAAGVRLEALEGLVPGHPVVRAMPNTPALVGLGAAAIAGGTHVDEAHLEAAEAVLAAVGTVVRVDEPMLDAVTGLSGSGPAYVFYLAESLMEAGAAQGLDSDVVERLVTQTLLGAATLLASSDEGPEQLRANVTSPGGTTAEGIRTLEEREVRAAVIDAVAAATRRSRELGGG